MKGTHSITINGRLYDAVTGMPIKQTNQSMSANQTTHTNKPEKPKARPSIHRAFSDIATRRKDAATPFKKVVAKNRTEQPKQAAHAVHQHPQKSQTLLRTVLKRPVSQPNAKPPVRQSPAITKFAPEKVVAAIPVEKAASQTTADTPLSKPSVHPAVAKALKTMDAKSIPQKPASPLNSKELKEQLIKERLAEVDAADKTAQESKRRFFSRKPRLTAILTSSLAILLLGGYLTYINLPNISMRVAATRAGIAANFPNYKPDGYSFEGPITYAPGEVSMSFGSNTNNNHFTLKQKGSNWDSQAVLDNYVSKQTDNYLTYQEKGLTIYSFDNKAAWVNGGLLYSIEGDAQLSSEQLLRLATSM